MNHCNFYQLEELLNTKLIFFFFTFFEIENYIWMQCQILPVSVQCQVDLKESKGDNLIQPWQQSKGNTGDFCLTSQATCVGH